MQYDSNIRRALRRIFSGEDMIKVAEFMKRHGMDAERVDMTEYTKAFLAAMERGLEAHQDTVPMIPTYLHADAKLPKGRKAVVIDAGGTNFRTGLACFGENGAVLERVDKHSMPGAEKPADWEEFISHVADSVMPLMEETEDIGFCFSYPAEVTEDIDSRILSLTKQVQINGSEGKPLGAELRKELVSRGVRVGKIAVLNDTPATLLGGMTIVKSSKYGGFIGMVAGTGFNACCMLPQERIAKAGFAGGRKMLVNLEAGSFDGFPRGDFDLELDEELPDTGHYIGEKMISGRYLGQLCMHVLKQAAREGLFSDRATETILKMTEVTTPTIDKWGSGRFPKGFTSEDKVNLVYIINELFERSARCIACCLCAVLVLTGEGTEKPVCIAVDGSLFCKSRLLRPELEKFMDIYAGEIMGRKYEFVTGEDMSLLGAAAAVVLN